MYCHWYQFLFYAVMYMYVGFSFYGLESAEILKTIITNIVID